MNNIAPTNEHAVPTSLVEQLGDSFQENVRIAASTAAVMSELGMPFEMTQEDEDAAHKLFSQIDKKKKSGTKNEDVNPPSLYQGSTALKLASLLTEYDHRVILDATQARTYITNRLLEISACGDPKSELRAIELLGKLSDVGAFTDKSEITITHRSANDLRQVIQDKISKLLQIDVVDVEAKSISDELGLLDDELPRTTEPTQSSSELA